MTTPLRDKLGLAVDALMDAVASGDAAAIGHAVGALLTVVFGNLTATLSATIKPIGTKLDQHGTQLEGIYEALRTIELRMDWQQARAEHLHNELREAMEAQYDAATARLDSKRAELDDIQIRLRALERGGDGTG